jgi:hypothetical protein
MESAWKRDPRDNALVLLTIPILLANVEFSDYVTNNLIIYIFDTPISVAYQATYPTFAFLLMAAAYLLILKRLGTQAILFGGTDRPWLGQRGLRPRRHQRLLPSSVDWGGARLHS